MASHYAKRIAEILSGADDDTANLVEELMRAEYGGTLDHLSPTAFSGGALDALADARAMHRLGTLAQYCEAIQVTLPAWAADASQARG